MESFLAQWREEEPGTGKGRTSSTWINEKLNANVTVPFEVQVNVIQNHSENEMRFWRL
jgi:hypothetical protein